MKAMVSARAASKALKIRWKELRPMLEKAGIQVFEFGRYQRVRQEDLDRFVAQHRLLTAVERAKRVDTLLQIATDEVRKKRFLTVMRVVLGRSVRFQSVLPRRVA